MAAIAAGGFGAVRIDALARALRVTKGSFYAHFPSRDALIEAALDRWIGTHGGPAVERLRTLEDPRERLRELLRQAVQASLGTTVQGRLLGEVGDERVRRALSEVTEARLALLRDTFAQMGFRRREAAERALAAYAVYIGLLHLSREAAVAWDDHLAETLDALMTSSPP